jgi:hypothetical protein
MAVRKERYRGSRGTYQGTRGFVGGARRGDDDTFFPTGAACEGYGDEVGDTGGYGEEETGYGSPCVNEGWHIAAVLEEGISLSRISRVFPDAFGVGQLREDGGELVVLRSTSPINPGPYRIFIQPVGTIVRLPAYSGVLEQGYEIQPNDERRWLVFVAPLTTHLGAADILLERPGGNVVISGLLVYTAYSDRSGSKFLRSLFPPNWAVGGYDPTVT